MLTLIRHAQSVGNEENRFSGRIDYPLTELGLKQAEEMCVHLVGQFDLIISSPLSRALHTASFLGVPKIIPELIERSGGEYEGKTFPELKKTLSPRKYKLWLREWYAAPPFGESYQDVKDRIWPIYDEQIKPLLISGRRICVVSHACVMKVLLGHLQGLDEPEIMNMHIANATPYVFRGPF